MATDMVVGPQGVSAALSGVLSEWTDAVVRAVNAESKASVRRLAKATRAVAPVGSRSTHYRSHISSRLLQRGAMGDTYVWYVKGKDARLSHLLERDHATGAHTGRAKGTHFIRRSLDAEEVTYVRNLREAIRRASR